MLRSLSKCPLQLRCTQTKHNFSHSHVHKLTLKSLPVPGLLEFLPLVDLVISMASRTSRQEPDTIQGQPWPEVCTKLFQAYLPGPIIKWLVWALNNTSFLINDGLPWNGSFNWALHWEGLGERGQHRGNLSQRSLLTQAGGAVPKRAVLNSLQPWPGITFPWKQPQIPSAAPPPFLQHPFSRDFISPSLKGVQVVDGQLHIHLEIYRKGTIKPYQTSSSMVLETGQFKH